MIHYSNLYCIRERVKGIEIESPSVEKVDTKIFHENITRIGYLVYYDTKGNNLQIYCASKNTTSLVNSGLIYPKRYHIFLVLKMFDFGSKKL